MASYFDEHDCEPLDTEPQARANMLLELARSLFNRMDFEDLGLVVDWDHHLPPPAAKDVVENLPRTIIRGARAELKCPVCLLEFEEEETAIEMPCHHLFHSNCILPWLNKVPLPPAHISALQLIVHLEIPRAFYLLRLLFTPPLRWGRKCG
ncbi:E3 ubiquitin-protein ligase RNF181 isoform X2 [Echinops telfairi]|uniref:E3 ubiquitin-protein ligase RNF181 isoform X2 n=1 Tax=Echinops telfairi TaxID=9371 RepID=A0AC55CNE3_ECHTE|nr:E3 ubiquitin-protein ligase RNF181 isoform X2 [Echinops telfairi]